MSSPSSETFVLKDAGECMLMACDGDLPNKPRDGRSSTEFLSKESCAVSGGMNSGGVGREFSNSDSSVNERD